MAGPKPRLTDEEVARPFQGALADRYPPVLSPEQLAGLVGLSVKTIYEWLAKGRLDGARRKRGKHQLIWRDRAIQILFDGKEWS